MKVVINHLSINNFKGIKSLDLPFDGRSATVAGRNATGKTSVYDAFLWLLFGKDSSGASRFDVKPLDAAGERITGLTTEVEASLTIDGKPVTLKRALIEKWRKVAGSPDPIYDRDETATWIDEVPVKLEKEYQPYIQQICGDEETFKQLTVHGAFMQLPWEQRRKMLLEASGKDVDSVILARPEFAGVPQLLNGKTPEDTKKRLKEQQKRYNDELKLLPARIDEQRLTRPSITQAELDEADKNIARLQQEIDFLDSQMAGTEQAYKHASELIAKQRLLDGELADRIRQIKKSNDTALDNLRSEAGEIEIEKANKHRQLKNAENIIVDARAQIDRLTKQKQELLDRWNIINDTPYEPPVIDGECPTCSQPLPATHMEHIRSAHKETFEAEQEDKLERINEQGKVIANSLKANEATVEDATKDVQSARAALISLEALADAAWKKATNFKPPFSPDQDPQCIGLQAQLDEIKAALDTQSSDEGREAYQAMRKKLQEEIKDWSAKQGQQALVEMVDKRIEELEAQKRDIGQKLALIDRDLDLLAAYVSARCEAMEGSINAMFDTIRWRLFELQKNGEYADVCKATVNGVSYESTLNNAARINAGIEIIRVLSKAKGTSVPCFVDNVEAVNKVAQTGGQMILLRVTEDPVLTLTKEA